MFEQTNRLSRPPSAGRCHARLGPCPWGGDLSEWPPDDETCWWNLILSTRNIGSIWICRCFEDMSLKHEGLVGPLLWTLRHLGQPALRGPLACRAKIWSAKALREDSTMVNLLILRIFTKLGSFSEFGFYACPAVKWNGHILDLTILNSWTIQRAGMTIYSFLFIGNHPHNSSVLIPESSWLEKNSRWWLLAWVFFFSNQRHAFPAKIEFHATKQTSSSRPSELLSCGT